MDRPPLSDNPFLERLAAGPLLAAELRPPPPDLGDRESMERWIDFHHGIRSLTRSGSPVFLTDDAVGQREEENLRHLTTNVAGEVDRSALVPFLTCKHSLSYCLGFAERSAAAGVSALVVLGGDRSTGRERCLPHAYQLRQRIRERVPDLALGGWVNPHADPVRQVDYLLADDATADFYLTQVVSHHSAVGVERFLAEASRRGLRRPGIFGVFFYRSPNPATLDRLSRFFPVPSAALREAFAAGATPEEICARSVRCLRELGVHHLYVSNLGEGRAPERMRRLREALRGPSSSTAR